MTKKQYNTRYNSDAFSWYGWLRCAPKYGWVSTLPTISRNANLRRENRSTAEREASFDVSIYSMIVFKGSRVHIWTPWM